MKKQKQNIETPQSGEESVYENLIFAWMAPRYLRYERGWIWFFMLFTSCAALAVYGYFTDAITMTVLFVILPGVLLLEHRKKPDMVEVLISEYGIRFGGILIPYSHIKRFWIIHNPPVVNELHLLTENRKNPELVIQLPQGDPARLRQFLVTQVYEWEGKHLSFLEALVRILRLN